MIKKTFAIMPNEYLFFKKEILVLFNKTGLFKEDLKWLEGVFDKKVFSFFICITETDKETYKKDPFIKRFHIVKSLFIKNQTKPISTDRDFFDKVEDCKLEYSIFTNFFVYSKKTTFHILEADNLASRKELYKVVNKWRQI